MAKKQTNNSEVPEKFDDALHELRGLMELLESEEISVDTLTQAIRRAAVLLKHCQGQLHSTEAEVKALMEELGVQSGNSDPELAD
jgi:exodeoxyribonuclease VII small subunit